VVNGHEEHEDTQEIQTHAFKYVCCRFRVFCAFLWPFPELGFQFRNVTWHPLARLIPAWTAKRSPASYATLVRNRCDFREINDQKPGFWLSAPIHSPGFERAWQKRPALRVSEKNGTGSRIAPRKRWKNGLGGALVPIFSQPLPGLVAGFRSILVPCWSEFRWLQVGGLSKTVGPRAHIR